MHLWHQHLLSEPEEETGTGSCINMTLRLDRLSVMRHHLIRSQIIQIALSSTLWQKQNPSCQVRKLGKASHFLRPTTSTLSSIAFHCSSLDVRNLALHNVRPIKLLRSFWLGQYDCLQLHVWNCNLNLLSFLAFWLLKIWSVWWSGWRTLWHQGDGWSKVRSYDSFSFFPQKQSLSGLCLQYKQLGNKNYYQETKQFYLLHSVIYQRQIYPLKRLLSNEVWNIES